MSFVPSHVTAVILYGHQACMRLGDLLKHWDAILDRNSWDQFIFVMIDQNPPVPEIPVQARQVLRNNFFKMSPDDLQFAGYPENIIQKLRDRIQNNSVSLQCIVSFDSSCDDSTEHLVKWIGLIQNDFGPDALFTVCYLLCGNQGYQKTRQKEFSNLLLDNSETFQYVYLLGDCAQDGSSVQDALLWRAVHSEVLINSSDMRQLAKNIPCSLGYSALNANNQELEAIRMHAAVRYLQEQCAQSVLLQTAWKILTHCDISIGGIDSAELLPVVKTWLDRIIAQQSVFPTKAERLNNRIFSGLYKKSRSPQEIQKNIERFYRYNCELRGMLEKEQAQYVQKHKQETLTQLSGLINAGVFPIKLLDAIENELKIIGSMPVNFSLPEWAPKSIFALGADHINQQCEAIEDALQRYYQATQRKLYAQSLTDVLDAVRVFVGSAQSMPGELDKMLIQLHTPQQLEEKYVKYTEQVNLTVQTKRGKLFTAYPGQRYFDMQGWPLQSEWQSNIETTAKQIGGNLPSACTGSFCKIIEWEFSTNESLNSFFKNYLATSRRMLREVFDTPGGVQSLYITASELSVHQWAQENINSIIYAGNDNVERIDLYPLHKDLSWYIDNNKLFQAADVPSGEARGPIPVFDGRNIPAAASEGTVAEAVQREQSADTQKTANAHNLCIHFMQDRYVLTWDWESRTDHAVVVISQPQGFNRSIVCSRQDFNEPVGGIPNGIDVTDSLPYGKVNITIRSQYGVYAQQDLCGKKRGIRYRFDRTQSGSVLKLYGQPDDIHKLFVKDQRENSLGQFILYPLDVQDIQNEYAITGFTVRDGSACILITDPADPFPTVYTERY